MEQVRDPAVLERILNLGWPWAGFAIGDLEPEWMQQCEWWRSGDTLMLLFNGLTPRLLWACGETSTLANMLATVKEQRVWANIHPDLQIAFDPIYRPIKAVRMLRMYWEGNMTGAAEAERLTAEHRAEIEELLKQGEWVLFVPQALESGHFYGIRNDNGNLIAMAGTHLATPRYNMAALGTVFTHPAHRGHGLGTLCCRSVLASVANAGITRMVLNVEEEKSTARRIYEQLGFKTACTYMDGEYVRVGKSSDNSE